MTADAVATKRRTRGDRTPRAELEQRMSLVEDLIAAGMPARKICQELERQKGWPQATVYRYIEQVRRRWLAEHEADRPTAAVARIARLQALSHKAEKDKAWSAVRGFEHLLAQIEGVLAPEKHDHRVAAVVVAPQAAPQAPRLEIVDDLPDDLLDALERAADARSASRALPAGSS